MKRKIISIIFGMIREFKKKSSRPMLRHRHDLIHFKIVELLRPRLIIKNTFVFIFLMGVVYKVLNVTLITIFHRHSSVKLLNNKKIYLEDLNFNNIEKIYLELDHSRIQLEPLNSLTFNLTLPNRNTL
jgi:hypothetical protein